MTRPTLVQVPYHLGQEGVGLGRGVPVLAETLAGLADDGGVVTRRVDYVNEPAACIEVVRALAERVHGVVAAGGLPVVLAGNCHSSLGTVAGLGRPVGVVWLDAHADFNTPDTSASGFFDGMALAMLTGAGWRTLRSSVAGHVPVPEAHVLLLGARDLDAPEEERLAASPIARAGADDLESTLDALRERVAAVYLHVDLDVLDPSVGRANRFAVDGGLTVGQVQDAVEAVRERFEIRAVALTAYEPHCDPEGAIPPAARAIAESVLARRTERVVAP